MVEACVRWVGVNNFKVKAEKRQLAIEGLRGSHNRCHVVLAIEVLRTVKELDKEGPVKFSPKCRNQPDWFNSKLKSEWVGVSQNHIGKGVWFALQTKWMLEASTQDLSPERRGDAWPGRGPEGPLPPFNFAF